MTLSGFSLLILAGGESSRMGSPKHLLPYLGSTVLDHILIRLEGLFDQVMLVGRESCDELRGVEPVQDVRTARCPLVGILSGLKAARNPQVFVLGCDMPFIEPALVRMLCARAREGADVVVPVVRGFREPLCAVYRGSTAAVIQEYLDGGNSKTTGFYSSVRLLEVFEEQVRACDPELSSFVNLNTPGEYRRHCSR